MKIILINHYAGSPELGMEFRPYYMSSEWIKQGHEVHIFAASYSHLRRKNPTIRKDLAEEVIDGIHYHWIKTLNYQGNGVRRALTMLQFVSKLVLHAKKIVRDIKPKIVIASSTYPLDTFAAQQMIKKTKNTAKLIHEIHDMWPATPIDLYKMPKWHPFVVAMQVGENSFCRHSDKIVSLAPCAKKYLVKHGMKEDKFVHIPNGIVEDEWFIPEQMPEHLKSYLNRKKNEGKFVICFFGSIINSYALETLVDAVKGIRCQNIQVVFVGKGIDKPNLQKKCEGDERFAFFDPISKKSIPDLLNNVDAVYVAGKKNTVFRFGVCMNKLFDSMMSGKPIIYAIDAPNNYILDYNCGINVAPENTEALEKGILKLLHMSEAERKQLGMNGRKAAEQNFTYKILAQKFLNEMTNLIF